MDLRYNNHGRLEKKNKIDTLGRERCENIDILLLSLLVLLSMLLNSRSMDLWKICISSLCSIDKLSFPSFSIFSFLPISSSVSQIVKELCSSSSYSFHLHHLSFNGIMKETISS